MKTHTVHSFTLVGPIGTEAAPIAIHASIDEDAPAAKGGLASSALTEVQIKEAAVRLRSALVTDGFEWPRGRVSVSVEYLAPVERPQQAAERIANPSALDLPIALAIIGAADPSHPLAAAASDLMVAGELGLDGSIRPTRGVLAGTLEARDRGARGVLVPEGNAIEALAAMMDPIGELLARRFVVYAPMSLASLHHLDACIVGHGPAWPRSPRGRTESPDFAEIRGHVSAVEAIERAVVEHLAKPAAKHADTRTAGVLLVGPPGTGKTMIARRIAGIMPSLCRDERIAVTKVYSAVGMASELVAERPFRAPHHTISSAALVGGAVNTAGVRRPGELHLATHGVLFLDEVVEFRVEALRALALEIRAMPAASRPLVVASANACPCGWAYSNVRECACTTSTVERYRARVGAAMEILGISWRIAVESLSGAELRNGAPGERSEVIRGRIALAVAGSAR